MGRRWSARAGRPGNDGGILEQGPELETLVAAAQGKARCRTTRREKSARRSQPSRAAFRAPGDEKAAAGEALHGELVSLVELSATGSRLRAKPRGYAGDYQTIDAIYDNVPAGAGAVGALVDACVLDLPALRAIRNRRRLLATEVLSSYRTAAKEFHVASLACGPAREVFDVLEKADDKGRLR